MPAPISLEELKSISSKVVEVEEYLPSSYLRYIDWEKLEEPEVVQYLSPGAIYEYQLTFVRSYVHVLRENGAIPCKVADEIIQGLSRKNVSYRKQQQWEDRLRHDIRGLVRACQEVLSKEARYYMYLGLTSYDVINSAWSAALRDVAYEVIVPKGMELSRIIIKRAREEKKTVMVGRTHKQHAAATTVGHWLMEILGGIMPLLIEQLNLSDNLKGKVSGFVGTFAAQKFLFDQRVDPKKLESETLSLMNLRPDFLTGQVVHQTYYLPYFANMISIAGNLAKFGEDLRNFQQTEVSEIVEQRLSEQVGSSTGVHKRNPIDSENIGGHWRQILPKIISVYEDYVTDFQRDLRSSSNLRYYGSEIPFITYHMLRKAVKVSQNMTIRRQKMMENLGITKGLILAEPLQLALQVYCIKKGLEIDSHEYVRKLSDRAVDENKDFVSVAKNDMLVREMLDNLSEEKRLTLLSPEKYVGTAEDDVDNLSCQWEQQLAELEDRIGKHISNVKYV
ncbi:MAG: lyase family protein [Nitrososphaeria archaeon]